MLFYRCYTLNLHAPSGPLFLFIFVLEVGGGDGGRGRDRENLKQTLH